MALGKLKHGLKNLFLSDFWLHSMKVQLFRGILIELQSNPDELIMCWIKSAIVGEKWTVIKIITECQVEKKCLSLNKLKRWKKWKRNFNLKWILKRICPRKYFLHYFWQFFQRLQNILPLFFVLTTHGLKSTNHVAILSSHIKFHRKFHIQNQQITCFLKKSKIHTPHTETKTIFQD